MVETIDRPGPEQMRNANRIQLITMTTLYRKASLLALAPLMTAYVGGAEAQVLPGAGTLLQQNQQTSPRAASSVGAGLSIEQDRGNKQLSFSEPFLVRSVQITGNTQVDDATLRRLLGEVEGKTMPLEQLGQAVDRITKYYRSLGYTLARAVIPTQTVRDGLVRVVVIEVRYGQIKLVNRSLVNDAMIQSTLAPLQGGQMVEQTLLDNRLLLLSDMPGVLVNATLAPGEMAGSSDLLVETAATRDTVGNLSLDNYGNHYTGRARAGAALYRIGLAGQGDVLSASILSSGRGLGYARLSYETLVPDGGHGSRLGGAYSSLRYRLGSELSTLDAHGTAEVGSVWLSLPLLRSRDANLYVKAQYDHRRLNDEIGISGMRDDRYLSNWVLTASGDSRDGWLADGETNANTWSAAWTRGRLSFRNAGARLADAATSDTEGRFSKGAANGTRLQRLNSANSLYLSLTAQWTNLNLDASEKLIAGGSYSVRAYDMGALSGDAGVMAACELRHDFGTLWGGQLQGLVFADLERIHINKRAWTGGVNDAYLRGGGAGANWYGPRQWSIKAAVAAPFGGRPELLAERQSLRAWIEINRGF